METTIGGDRLGSGNKQVTSFKNYERSSHDLSYLWRSSLSAGTLVPFMSELALPGDKWEINLNCEVMTLPTIGPLFGSYKVQLDIFEIPMRLYNAKLHMNKLGIGMDMNKIFLPRIQLMANNHASYVHKYTDNEHINPSSLMKYLGVSGLGRISGNVNPAKRYFNAVPLLAYWSIYKNYYSNKQEEIGAYIHTNDTLIDEAMTPVEATLYTETGSLKGSVLDPNTQLITEGDTLKIIYGTNAQEPDPAQVVIEVMAVATNLTTAFESFEWDNDNVTLICYNALAVNAGDTLEVMKTPTPILNSDTMFFGVKTFPLENIDKTREEILQYAGADAYTIWSTNMEPYSSSMDSVGTNEGLKYSVQFSQESLGLKTYQSDLFNNWINSDWIDGTGGISELTAVDTTTGEFTIDALNIATKVYEMLNRIAISGGTYDNWLEAVYTHERVKGVEEPVYCGSLIKELSFEEVISQAETVNDGRKAPLGTLAGRGRMTGKHKGGDIEISVNEPSYIMGIVSLTPRIDYSQGNKWDLNLKTYDDFHKPALDAIGFQDLITEQMLWSDSELNADTEEYTVKSLGKQPAWINYMTAVNRTFGSFADENDSMWMTLNRRYERNSDGTLKDGTTYIDPTKYNQIFANRALDSQNFWVQISNNITCRRKMSAKVIPNL